MATLTKEEILDGIAELSVIQLSELLKDFEERFGVGRRARDYLSVYQRLVRGHEGSGRSRVVPAESGGRRRIAR